MGVMHVLDSEAIRRAIIRMAHEICEKEDQSHLVLIGIRTRGVTLANRLAKAIEDFEKIKVPVGILDITLYRDDLTSVGSVPLVRETLIDFDIKDKRIVLVDYVLYTGRTIRAALDALTDFGRPGKIELAVLVDRGHRELPIRADFVGKNIPTSKDQNVKVSFGENDDGADAVTVQSVQASGRGGKDDLGT